MPQEGIEPPTLALGVPCSVLLSYWGVRQHYTPDAWAASAYRSLSSRSIISRSPGWRDPIHLDDIDLLRFEALGESSQSDVDNNQPPAQQLVDRIGHARLLLDRQMFSAEVHQVLAKLRAVPAPEGTSAIAVHTPVSKSQPVEWPIWIRSHAARWMASGD